MATILNLETTTTNCSASLGINGEIAVLKEDKEGGYSHAEKLHVFIQEVLEEANIKFSHLDAVAVSKGPGSYTGLRIGVSAAKGLCFSLNIPLISISTLEALAHQVDAKQNEVIVPMLDARRMEVYTAVYSSEKVLISPIEAKVLEEHSFDNYFSEFNPVHFIGNGVKKFEEISSAKNAFFIDALPSAKEMAKLAEAKYEKSDTEDVAYFEPYYLKDFIVNRKN
ncbi:tRNA (adenosine(37)-N6)-threonylcarbamoyltransferase complex dimerization subunit type 1 TsaB [Mesonia sp.]|uniref:tRNA (adenosine(37)-N6)-threonylcarbamoyltransferase complex dimerization subunit type 1 TsaB n=1 Tax=Mesonia sp. TaxID=1960830 RepID=UPI0017794750|nr:tRNA (adenosine(37)-N6)-threonylcarbamoyltransferase complex dimerization subunit type 1 TsaB [Mesonia sp.]HIB36526.1 tRNA (adenosine(37)-N6)-threonylcarbamoyltransferase complex dimerization subunit type 1 TsaB [Mesonia sp.]HIO26668.1 tRNA (adenosine(37)-N6)-threonylcarbamoyltransferase complex dimerization subunit type 1 TsaB [Flavobacteriaceae bacterium]